MGRVTGRLLVCLAVICLWMAALPGTVAAFTGFGAVSADSTYGDEMVFRVGLVGGAPDRLELLLRFSDSDEVFVAPVTPDGDAAVYRWDLTERYLTPNTRISYQWRATEAGATRLSERRSLLHDDDRPGLDWQATRIGDATVHWYGGAEAQARRFGKLTADGARAAEELLGHQLDGSVDIYVYDTRDEFFGALGPGAREWTGAATYPALRTIFMWLGGGDAAYLETAMVHEVTHVVFNDATDNPFHEPAKWLNEGLATWAERQSADAERAIVESEADGGGLFAFDAIADQFPIGNRGSSLSYAQGTTMIDMIIDEHGREALSRMAAAYRDGASDDEAIRAGTGLGAVDLYAEFYASFGADEPVAVEPAPIPPSNVRKPGGGGGDGGTDASPATGPDARPGSAPDEGPEPVIVAAAAAILVLGMGIGWLVIRRRSMPGRAP